VKHFRNPDGIHRPVANYTHQIEVSGIEKLLFLSGQIGMDESGRVPEDPLDQLDLALENILANLKTADMGMSNLTKMTLYLVGEMDASRRRKIINAKLKGHEPCMTLLFVAALASPSLKVEIDAFAVKDA
jgi:enamine deaminase RidA (YjgF/YER057c/UK114 family)